MKMGSRQQAVHKAFLELHPEFEPTKVYEALCKAVKLSEDAIERGLGRLFKEGKLRSKERRPKHKRSKGSGGGRGQDDFR